MEKKKSDKGNAARGVVTLRGYIITRRRESHSTPVALQPLEISWPMEMRENTRDERQRQEWLAAAAFTGGDQ